MDYLAKIYVTLKPAVNDPQGITVLGALKNLGFTHRQTFVLENILNYSWEQNRMTLHRRR